MAQQDTWSPTSDCQQNRSWIRLPEVRPSASRSLPAFSSLREERFPNDFPRSWQGACACSQSPFPLEVPSPLKTSKMGPKAKGSGGNTKSSGSCRGMSLPTFTPRCITAGPIPARIPCDRGFLVLPGSIYYHYCNKIKCNHIYIGFSTISKTRSAFNCRHHLPPSLPSHCPAHSWLAYPALCLQSFTGNFKEILLKSPSWPPCPAALPGGCRITAIEGLFRLYCVADHCDTINHQFRYWGTRLAPQYRLRICGFGQWYKYCRWNYGSSRVITGLSSGAESIYRLLPSKPCYEWLCVVRLIVGKKSDTC